MKEQITISRKDAEWLLDFVRSMLDELACDHKHGICMCEDRIIINMLDDKIAGRIP